MSIQSDFRYGLSSFCEKYEFWYVLQAILISII